MKRLTVQCSFIKSDNNRCQMMAIKGTDLCLNHNPNSKNLKAMAVRSGGLNRKLKESYGKQSTIESPNDIKVLLSKVINGVWTGTIPSNQPANTIGFLSRCFLDAYEIGEMTIRLEKLEKELALKTNKI